MDQPSRKAMAGKLQIYADGLKNRENLSRRPALQSPAAAGRGRQGLPPVDVAAERVA